MKLVDIENREELRDTVEKLSELGDVLHDQAVMVLTGKQRALALRASAHIQLAVAELELLTEAQL